ncbi:MAG: tyrosine-type recombinase/integrase [Actinomycetota bacterium]
MQAVRTYLTWLGQTHPEGFPLDKAAAQQRAVAAYQEWLTETRYLSPQTTGQYLHIIGDFYRRRGLEGSTEGRPTTAAEAALEPLPAHLIQRYLRVAERDPSPRDRLAALLPYYAGLRTNEVARLRTDEVVLPAKGGELRLPRYGQGAGRPRRVPVHACLRRAIEAWLAERPSWTGASESPALLLGDRGGPISEAKIRALVANLGRRADPRVERADRLTTGVLRATFRTQLLGAGTDPATVANLLGQGDDRAGSPPKFDRHLLDALVTDETELAPELSASAAEGGPASQQEPESQAQVVVPIAGGSSVQLVQLLNEALLGYRDQLTAAPLLESTKKQRLTLVRSYFSWLAQSETTGDPLHDPALRDRAMDGYRNWLRIARGIAPSAVQSYERTIQDFFTRCGVAPPEPAPEELEIQSALTDRLAQRYLRAVAWEPSARDRLAALLPYYAGARPNEAIQLHTDDVCLDNGAGSLRIRSNGRGDGPARLVPLHPALRTALEEWLAQRPDWAGPGENPLLLLDGPGKPMAQAKVIGLIRAIGRRADPKAERPEPLRAGVLRATLGSQLLRAGVDQLAVARLLGNAPAAAEQAAPGEVADASILDALVTDRTELAGPDSGPGREPETDQVAEEEVPPGPTHRGVPRDHAIVPPQGVPPSDYVRALNEAFAAYSDQLDATQYADPVKRIHLNTARTYLSWLATTELEGDPLNDPSARDLAVGEYLRAKVASGTATKTMQRWVPSINDFYVRRGIEAPTEGLGTLAPQPELAAVSDQLTRRYLWVAERLASERDRVVALLPYYAGLRETEIVALTLDDLTLSDHGGELAVWKYRGEAGRGRRVPIHAALSRALAGWLAERPGWPGASDSPNVVLNDQGGPITAAKVRSIIVAIGRRADPRVERAEPLTPAVVRATFGSQLRAAGVDPGTVGALMGEPAHRGLGSPGLSASVDPTVLDALIS